MLCALAFSGIVKLTIRSQRKVIIILCIVVPAEKIDKCASNAGAGKAWLAA